MTKSSKPKKKQKADIDIDGGITSSGHGRRVLGVQVCSSYFHNYL